MRTEEVQLPGDYDHEQVLDKLTNNKTLRIVQIGGHVPIKKLASTGDFAFRTLIWKKKD
jgi:hypothetical protein